MPTTSAISDPYMVTAKDIYDGKIQYDSARRTDLKAFKSRLTNKSKPRVSDILVTKDGSLGRVAKVTRTPLCINQSVALVRTNPSETIPDHIKYLLQSSTYQNAMLADAGGSTIKHIYITRLAEMPVIIPPIDQQTHIASIISAYDDLIENNERRIKVLEEMAQRLYTEWFVKFKFPGHEEVKMVDSGTEYGRIPEGWEVKRLGEVTDFINGYAFKPAQLGKIGYPIIKIPELRSGVTITTPRNNGVAIPDKYAVKKGDLLFSWSASLVVNVWQGDDALLNQHLFRVLPSQGISKSLCYFWISDLIEKVGNHTVGSTMKHLRREAVVGSKAIVPPKDIMGSFEEICSNYFKEITGFYSITTNLRITRDLLIENLVTGKRLLIN